MKRRTLIFALFAASLSATTLYARQTAKPPAGAVAKKRFVTTDAAQVQNTFLPSGGSLTTLIGEVVIQSEDSTLQTEKATYNEETEIATAPTRLRLDDKQNTLTADRGVAYYTTGDADFTGNVVINARPKPSGSPNASKGSLRRNFKDPVTITCGKVRYNWRTKRAVLTENLVIKQKDRTITGDRGLYDGVAETVTLVGNIKSRRPTGDTGDAPGKESRAVASFKEGAESVLITRDPTVKKLRGVVPVREKPNGDVEVIESVDGSADTPPPTTETPTPTTPPVTPPAGSEQP